MYNFKFMYFQLYNLHNYTNITWILYTQHNILYNRISISGRADALPARDLGSLRLPGPIYNTKNSFGVIKTIRFGNESLYKLYEYKMDFIHTMQCLIVRLSTHGMLSELACLIMYSLDVLWAHILVCS